MKEVLIVEKCASRIQLNENSAGAASNGSKKYILDGKFTELNVLNRNNRIYTKDNFVPHVESLMQKKNSLGVIYGEFDHPEGFEITLTRSSHTIESLKYDESSNAVLGSIKLLNNYFGKEAKSLVDDDCPLFVSSRASGITEANQLVQIRQLFTYDLVADPGFASARVNLKNINEQFGLPINEGLTRIYDFVNESSMENFIMDNNNNETVTKQHLKEYSNFLEEKFKNMELLIAKSIKENVEADKVQTMIQNYENLQENLTKINKYVKYLSTSLQIVVEENKAIKNEQLNNINYNNYLYNKLEKTISFAEHIAENLKVNNDFTEYVAENTAMNIKYSEHIAENLKLNNDFSEYIAENVKDNIQYFDYITENMLSDKKYVKYLAENVDGLINFGVTISEKLNNKFNTAGVINEDVVTIDSPVDFLNNGEEDEDETVIDNEENTDITASEENPEGETSEEGEENGEEQTLDNPLAEPGMEPAIDAVDEPEVTLGDDTAMVDEPVKTAKIIGTGDTGTVISIDPDGTVLIRISGTDEQQLHSAENIEYIDNIEEEPTGDLLEATKKFINEVKKRETSRNEKPHFFNFLSEAQISDFKALTAIDQEKVKLAINESEYLSSNDIMRIIAKTLSPKELTKEERIVKALPEDLKPIWESLDSNLQKNILSKSKFFNLRTDEHLVNFWESADLNAYAINENSALINENSNEMKDNDTLSDVEIAKFMNKFNSIK